MGLLDRFAKTTPDQFAGRLIKALRAAGCTEELRYEADEFQIVRSRNGEQVGIISLANHYRVYLDRPRRERAGILKTCARSTLSAARELPEDFESARPDLRLKIHVRSTPEQIRLRAILNGGKDDAFSLPGEPIGEHLLACPVFDWPESIRSINSDDLSRWGVTVYEALEVGRQNLAETTQSYATIGDGLHVLASGDNYDASRLTLIDLIRSFKVKGRPVAMVPDRDGLLVTGSDDDDGLALMLDLAERRLGEPYPLSAMPLILEDDEWEDWMPPREHPLSTRFRNMELKWLWSEYDQQKKLLDAVHEARGVDIFVANFSALETSGGELVSYCVWGENVDSLLPIAQKVAIMRHGLVGPAAIGDWDHVREIAGDLMERTDDYPPRFRVRQIPDQAALEVIGVGEL